MMSIAMSEERITRLTRRQQDCLRLVAQGYTSKEIGRRLGISFSTVDNHIQTAVQVLEVDGRAEAGRLLVQMLEETTRQRLPSHPPNLAERSLAADKRAETQPRGWRRSIAALLPPIGGKDNALTPSQTILAIVSIAFLAALAFIACVMVVKMSFRVLT